MKILVAMFILLTSTVYADKQTYGSWDVDARDFKGGTLSFANTSNDSGSIFGVMCFSTSGECQPILINGLSCDEDVSYPALVGVDDGITSVDMGCVHIEDRYIFTLPVDQLEYVVTMNRYSIAFGVQGGRFKAAYFSLSGSAKAVIAAKVLIGNKKKSNKEKVESNEFGDELL